MVKGGTNFRKSSQRRYQKRKAPPGKKKVFVVNVVEDMVGKGSGTSVDEVVIEPSKQTISEEKIKEIPVPANTEEFTAPTGYRFMDMCILDTVFSMVSCHQCYCTSLVQNKKQGLSFEIKLVCGSIDCDWCHIFCRNCHARSSIDCDDNIVVFLLMGTWQKCGFTSLNGAVAAISI